MAYVKISALGASTAWATTDLFELDNGGVSRSISGANVFAGLFPTVGQLTFPATQVASAGANVLDDYEEGTWTPNDQSAGGLTFTSAEGFYTKIGNLIVATFTLTFPATADANENVIGTLPFTSTASSGRNTGFLSFNNCGVFHYLRVAGAQTFFRLSTVAGVDSLNSVFSGAEIRGCAVYTMA